MTQEELAERLGLSRATVARYELGEIEPKLQNLISLSKVLEVSADYLLGIKQSEIYVPSELSDDAVAALNQFVAEVIKTTKE